MVYDFRTLSHSFDVDREGRFQGGFSWIYDNLNSLACLHLLLISDLLFKYEASARAITTFSVKQRSQQWDPFLYGFACLIIDHFILYLRPFFFNFQTYLANSDFSKFYLTFVFFSKNFQFQFTKSLVFSLNIGISLGS